MGIPARDYRLMVALKSVELFRRTLETGSFRGSGRRNWLSPQPVKSKGRCKGILYSYLEPGTCRVP